MSQSKRSQAVGGGVVSAFVRFQPSTDWMRPTPRGRMICFTQATDSNVNLTPRPPHRHTKIMFDQISGHHPLTQSG